MMFRELLMCLERSQYIARMSHTFERKFIISCDALDLIHNILKQNLLDQNLIFGATFLFYFANPHRLSFSQTIENNHLILFLTSAEVNIKSVEYFFDPGHALICCKEDVIQVVGHEVEYLDIILVKK